MKTNEILKRFKSPPGEYRPAPLWVWNDAMTHSQIDEQLWEFKSHGFGGAFVHPRTGLLTEYLSEEWFSLWGYALEKSRELGLILYIYDEYACPSGFAGGIVSGQHPDELEQLVRIEIVDSVDSVTDYLSVFAIEVRNEKIICQKNLSHIPKTDWKQYGDSFLILKQEKGIASNGLAGFAYVDMMRPQIHQAFMQCTYEEYYKRFGKDFGTQIPAVFTDEPNAGRGSRKDRLPFSRWFAAQFQKRNHYDLIRNLPCLFINVEGEIFDYPATKIRFDYYDTIHDLFVKNSVEATAEWCEKHGINWTGHYYEHTWPHLSHATSPAVQSYYEYHQWPAIDMLYSHYLRDDSTHQMTHVLHELKSVSNQFEKKRCLCELYGAGGWDSSFEDYKRMGDWVMVNGVNFINQHLSYSSIMGTRKYDFPQAFDWREPWWNEYTAMNDYLSRLSMVLSQGKMEQRILVLNPTTTGYLCPPKDESGTIEHNTLQFPDMSSFLSLCQRLTDLQWDFDLGDEYILGRHGTVNDKKLIVAKQAYEVVIVSGDMRNMLSSTVSILQDCAKCGIKILAVGTPGRYVDGLLCDSTYRELENALEQISVETIDQVLLSLLSRRIHSTMSFPAGFHHMRRKMDDGTEFWFFVNHAKQDFKTQVSIRGRGVKQLDLFSGDEKSIAHSFLGEWINIPLVLTTNQSMLLMVTTEIDDTPIEQEVFSFSTMRPDLIDILPEKENVLPLCYADYLDQKNTYVKGIRNRIFRERGFESNPWEGVQLHRNFLDRNSEFDEQSGFRVAYHFTVADDFCPKKISVVAEQPDLCYLIVNGQKTSWLPNETYLDRNFGVADIAAYIQSGENTVEVVVDRFQVQMEIDNIYIKGDFSVIPENGKWVISKPSKLTHGSWRDQGYPFYPHAVEYRYQFNWDGKRRQICLDLGDYNASAVSARINGRYIGLLHEDGKRGKVITDYLREGTNVITVRVCGSYKNLLGPLFSDPYGIAFPKEWDKSPEILPSTDKYCLKNYGLYDAPIIEIKQ